ncbi:MAG: HlyC/CorC family transporter [Clostridia bacterium]|nr:HlyC/CorC family transporter [Clostridia bacterium]
MDPSQWILILVLIVLLILSGFFSASETAYTSISRIRLKSMEAAGDKRARKAIKLLDSYDKLLTTILIGNNIVNITMASLATILFLGLIANSDVATVTSTAVVTGMTLIFGEVTPKVLAKERPEGFAFFSYPILAFLMLIFTPLTFVFSAWKKLLIKIFKIKKADGMTEDELLTMVETAHDEGGLDEHESELIRSAIEFEDMAASDIMVPRVNVIAVAEDAPIEQIADLFAEHGYSRLPVYSGTIDSVVGILHEKDVFALLRAGNADVKSALSNTVCVSENMKISAVLRMIQKARVHMAVVVDEFGGTAGIVTLEDILEELVGEIWDEHDEVEVLYQKVDDNTFLVSGAEKLEDMFEEMGVETRDEFDSTTVGGFVTEKLEHIPKAGERLTFENLDILVTKANLKRVIEVKVRVNEPVEEEE